MNALKLAAVLVTFAAAAVHAEVVVPVSAADRAGAIAAHASGHTGNTGVHAPDVSHAQPALPVVPARPAQHAAPAYKVPTATEIAAMLAKRPGQVYVDGQFYDTNESIRIHNDAMRASAAREGWKYHNSTIAEMRTVNPLMSQPEMRVASCPAGKSWRVKRNGIAFCAAV